MLKAICFNFLKVWPIKTCYLIKTCSINDFTLVKLSQDISYLENIVDSDQKASVKAI